MKLLLTKITSSLILLCLSIMAVGQTSAVKATYQSSLPSVFILGEHDVQYEEMMPGYETLLEACNGDMEIAFGKLVSMMKEMEAYADLSGFDLKGINAWMHFFWREDGSIDHIGFHLKPNSRNVSTEKLANFLNDFASNYKFPLSASVRYAHYSSFAFPVAYRPIMSGAVGSGN